MPAVAVLQPQAVKVAARDALFRQAQDRVARQLYFDPSQRLARSLGLRWVHQRCNRPACRSLCLPTIPAQQ